MLHHRKLVEIAYPISLCCFLKVQPYDSFSDFLLQQRTRTTRMHPTSTPVVTWTSTPVSNNMSLNFYDLLEVFLGCIFTTFSGTGCYCFFKFIRNKCQCKVTFQFKSNRLYFRLLVSMVVIEIQKLSTPTRRRRYEIVVQVYQTFFFLDNSEEPIELVEIYAPSNSPQVV
jgi:hypothetical protein